VTVAAPAALLGELCDLKRVRTGGRSVAERGFARAWAALAGGEAAEVVARREAALALAATRLGAIDAAVLRDGGLDEGQAAAVVRDAARSTGALTAELEAALDLPAAAGAAPAFVAALAGQPRAGATAPGRPRLVLEPAESHAEHCWAVGVLAVLLAPGYGAEPDTPWLCALGHHLHNAALPDGGFAGETALGEHLEGVVERFTRRALQELSEPLRGAVRDARALTTHADTPQARAFNAADVLDRVLEMGHHARAAAFTLDQALDDLELVHPGPLQAFGLGVVREWELA
jgi:5'-deoxynucleotidase YfbR-like HD superfamily hydrolase